MDKEGETAALVPEEAFQEALDAARQKFVYSVVDRWTARAKGIARQLSTALKVIVAAMGWDVSYWQTAVDFNVAQGEGLGFVWIRATIGMSADTRFVTHWNNSRGKMKRGPYLYYKDAEDPKLQAQFLYNTLVATGDLGELPPMLDIEGVGNLTLTASKIKLCLEELELLFGKTPTVYTGYYVWRDDVTGTKDFASAYPLVIAGYPLVGWQDNYPELVLNYPPLIPFPWTEFFAWQWTAYAPAVKFGALGNTVDLEYASPEMAEQYLGDPPPTSDEETMLFKTNNNLYIRKGPGTNYAKVGLIPLNAEIKSKFIKILSGGNVWVCLSEVNPAWITQTSPEYWCAAEYLAGNPLADFIRVE